MLQIGMHTDQTSIIQRMILRVKVRVPWNYYLNGISCSFLAVLLLYMLIIHIWKLIQKWC